MTSCSSPNRHDPDGKAKVLNAADKAKDLLGFGTTVEVVGAEEAGYQLDRVQRGLDPDDWRPMPAIGAGVREIRVRERAGAFRVIYVATFADVVYVLHAFQKKTRQTAKRDVDLAASRLREQMARRR
jgi:phage-related protein